MHKFILGAVFACFALVSPAYSAAPKASKETDAPLATIRKQLTIIHAGWLLAIPGSPPSSEQSVFYPR